MVYTLRFFLSSKCSLFHNSKVFGSWIIHMLYTGVLKLKKNNSGAKRLRAASRLRRLDNRMAKTTNWGASSCWVLREYYSGEHKNWDFLGEASSTHGGTQGSVGKPEGQWVLGRPNFRLMIILKLISEQGQLRAVLKAVFNIHVLCHHGMAGPQVAERGTASNMEVSCE